MNRIEGHVARGEPGGERSAMLAIACRSGQRRP